jgi:16S rRNA (uracil1498-N3)-methyltransferase
VLGDGAGELARCRVEEVGRAGLRARVLSRWSVARAAPPVTVVQALPKSERSEYIPAVTGVLSTAALAARTSGQVTASAVVLALHESATAGLTDLTLTGARSLALLVGPEGGITDEEISALTGAGAAPVRLGPTVLRTSTAAAVALGALGVLTRRWELK